MSVQHCCVYGSWIQQVQNSVTNQRSHTYSVIQEILIIIHRTMSAMHVYNIQTYCAVRISIVPAYWSALVELSAK